MDRKFLVELTTEIVSAHASMNEMKKEELLDEMRAVFQKLLSLAGSVSEEAEAVPQEIKPAVPVKRRSGRTRSNASCAAKPSPP